MWAEEFPPTFRLLRKIIQPQNYSISAPILLDWK